MLVVTELYCVGRGERFRDTGPRLTAVYQTTPQPCGRLQTTIVKQHFCDLSRPHAS
jgi:hypothetical protein